MRIKRLALVGLTSALMGAAFAATPSAEAAVRDGDCDSGEFCLYYNSNQAGSVSDFNSSISDYGASQPSCYEFKGAGAGKGRCVKNEAASVRNRASVPVTVHYNSGYGGASQTIAAGAKVNLNATLKNENASHKFGSGAAPSSCRQYKVFGLRGSGESSSGNFGMGNTVGPTADRLRGWLPEGSVELVGIPYPAVGVEVLAEDPGRFMDSMRLGGIMLRKEILDTIDDCPATRIAVIGYSQGAGVASETLRGLPSSAFDHVRAAALYADTYSAGDTDDAVSFDYFDNSRRVSTRSGAGVFGGRRLPSALRTKYDICFDNDLVCDLSNSTGGMLVQAFFVDMHSHYKDWAQGIFPTLPDMFGAMMSNAIRK